MLHKKKKGCEDLYGSVACPFESGFFFDFPFFLVCVEEVIWCGSCAVFVVLK